MQINLLLTAPQLAAWTNSHQSQASAALKALPAYIFSRHPAAYRGWGFGDVITISVHKHT
eukprot:scaffold99651_cov23-Prasinocladus_malaysianus.AAC.1